MTALPALLPRPLTLPCGEALAMPTAERLTVRLRLTHRKRFRFHHSGMIHGLLCEIFDHDLPRGLLPWVPESGQVFYEAGDSYVFSLTFVGEARRRIAEVEPALSRLTLGRWKHGPRRCLDGNFLVESAVRTRVEPGRDPEALDELAHAGDPVRIRFLSPLRQKRPRDLARPGAGHLDAECFPAACFLRRLYQRWHLLRHGAYPPGRAVPEPPPGATADPGRLLWVDLPMRGADPGKRMTLGGVVGEVVLSHLAPPWRALLMAMQPLHAGASPRYGLGRYVLENLPLEPPPAPASSHLERLAGRESLARAADREARSGGAGLDGVTPAAFLAAGAAQLDELGDELRKGRYRPDPLRVVDGHGVPTVRDRIVQRALVSQLSGPLEAFRRERPRSHGAGAPIAAGELAALFPLEPAIDLLETHLTAKVHHEGRLYPRPADLPVVSPLVELFGRRSRVP